MIPDSEYVIRENFQCYCANLNHETNRRRNARRLPMCQGYFRSDSAKSMSVIWNIMHALEDAIGPCMVSTEGVC